MNKISLIVPVYNVQDYLAECLTSLVNQDYSNKEILIVDDGSTDGSAQICDSFVKRFECCTVFHKKNGGLSDARNFGMKHAQGEYILFIDSDDYLKDGTLSKVISLLEATNSDSAVFTYCKVDESGKALDLDKEASQFPSTGVVSGQKALEHLLLGHFESFVWRIVFRRDIWTQNNLGFPSGRLYEDVLTTYRFFFFSQKVCFLNQRLYCYRQRQGSIIHDPTIDNLVQFRNSFLERSRIVKMQAPEMRELCEAQVLMAHYRIIMAPSYAKVTEKSIIEFKQQSEKFIQDTKITANDRKIFTKLQLVTLYIIHLGLFKNCKTTIWGIKRLKEIYKVMLNRIRTRERTSNKVTLN